ncbi:hypothetical protein NDK43_12010 [Neobacillus pocheonensis]|uniref:Uncharacterized protein n=1 Tax=Neobacillus pocheonensis TaxID=363869 RepID=A0ABT0W9I2_9BACI|nr:hypothetical protein [Neobacillus pocheonensis]
MQHEQIHFDNSFILVEPHTSLIHIKNKLLEYDFVVVSGGTNYIIASSECSLVALDNDSLPVINWIEKVNWLSSTVSTIVELSTSKIDWIRQS